MRAAIATASAKSTIRRYGLLTGETPPPGVCATLRRVKLVSASRQLSTKDDGVPVAADATEQPSVAEEDFAKATFGKRE